MSEVNEIRECFRAENGLRSRAPKQADKKNTLEILRQRHNNKGAAGHLSASSSDRYDTKNEPGCSRHGSENRSGAQGQFQEQSKPEDGKQLGSSRRTFAVGVIVVLTLALCFSTAIPQ
jgi:hypothetical protein